MRARSESKRMSSLGVVIGWDDDNDDDDDDEDDDDDDDDDDQGH